MPRRQNKALIADLPRGISVRKTKNSAGTSYFRVELREKFTGRKGKAPITRNFKILKDARDWIFGEAKGEKVNHQSQVEFQRTSPAHAFEMKPGEVAEAARAVRLCRAAGITLTEVVEKGLGILRPAGGQKKFSDLASFCERKFETLYRKGECSRSHAESVQRAGRRFAADFSDASVAEISHAIAEDWLGEEFDDAETNTTRYYARYLHIIFSEAVDRKWTAENPFTRISRQSVSEGDIEFLRPDDLTRLLYFAQTEAPWIVLPIAIKAFGGLRTSELLSLTWKEIGEGQIEIKASRAKTRRARPVTISPALRAWFAETDPQPDANPIVERGRRTWFTAFQKIASIGKIPVPKNALRHSFGTFHYHLHRHENLTAAEMGNTPDTVVKWYKAPIVSKEELKSYWDITPASVSAWAISKGLSKSNV